MVEGRQPHVLRRFHRDAGRLIAIVQLRRTRTVVVARRLQGLARSTPTFSISTRRARRAGFGDGFAAIILPAYLIEIGFDPFQIGLVATAALLGSAATDLGHRVSWRRATTCARCCSPARP